MRKLLLEALDFESALNLHLNLWPNMTTSFASQPQVNIILKVIWKLVGARTCYLEFRSFLRAHNLVLERRITWNRWGDDSFDGIFAMVQSVEILHRFPVVVEDVQVDVQLTIQEGHHQIPGPPQTTSENGDPVNEQLLQAEQHDIEAGRLLLGLDILSNAITVQHYRCVLKSLRDKLRELPPHEVPNGDAYARILLRLMDRLMSFLGDEDNIVLYLRRRNYDEWLGKLLNEMAEGFVFMQQGGMEEEVYVRNKELHAEYLRYLASHLSRA